MATEVDHTYLGRLFINQYMFKLDIRLQRLCCSVNSAFAAAPNTLPLLLLRLLRLPHLRPSDSKDTCEHLEKSDRLLSDAIYLFTTYAIVYIA